MKKKYILAATMLAFVCASTIACSSNNNSASSSKSASSKVVKKSIKKKKANKKTKKIKIDYLYTSDTEAALGAGKDLDNKVVRFKVDKLEPQSAFGYNLEAGQHLNFVSPHNPKVKAGDVVTVKIKEVTSTLGSFIIKYSDLKKVPAKSLTQDDQNKLTQANQPKGDQ